MVICLEQGADLHIAQRISLPLTVSCFSKIQFGFTFLVPAHPGSPGQRAVKRGCVCVCVYCLLLNLIRLMVKVDTVHPRFLIVLSRTSQLLACQGSTIHFFSLGYLLMTIAQIFSR